MTAAANAQSSALIEHCICEVGGEILSKPNALSDILEFFGFPKTIIYCNSPSDTDLLEVLLRKRGTAASKLIGYVSPSKSAAAMERLLKGEISTLVVTDIAARALDLSEFELAINYSVHNDPDVYLQRATLAPAAAPNDGAPPATERTKPLKVISLVAPLDIASFHSVKKAVDAEFVSLPLPKREDLLRSRVTNLAAKAAALPVSPDDSMPALAKLVLEHPQRDALVGFLLKNTLETLPQIAADLEKANAERLDFEEEMISQRDEGFGNRRGGGQGGYRGDRGEEGPSRGGGRGGRQRDRGGYQSRDRDYRGRDGGGGGGGRDRDRRDREHGSDEPHHYRDDNDEGQPTEGYQQRGRNGRRGGGRDYDEGEGDRRPPRVETIRLKEDRLYIGRGQAHGFSQEKFRSLLSSTCGVEDSVLKRFSLRENYSFADVPAEASENILEKLKTCVGDDGSELYVARATTLSFNQPVAPGESSEGSGDEGQFEDSNEGYEHVDEDSGSQDSDSQDQDEA